MNFFKKSVIVSGELKKKRYEPLNSSSSKSGRSFLSSSRYLSRSRGILSKFARTASATVYFININRGLSSRFVEPQKYSQRSIRRSEKLVLTQNKLNICCVKLQKILKIPLIVLAPFEVPLHVPLHVQVSLNVRARNSLSLLLILIGQDSLQAPLLVLSLIHI